WGAVGTPGHPAERDLLEGRLGRRRQGNRVTVTAEAAVHPQDVNHGLFGGGLFGLGLRHRHGAHPLQMLPWTQGMACVIACRRQTLASLRSMRSTTTGRNPQLAGVCQLFQRKHDKHPLAQNGSNAMMRAGELRIYPLLGYPPSEL